MAQQGGATRALGLMAFGDTLKAAMAFSSVSVVGNALLLRRWHGAVAS